MTISIIGAGMAGLLAGAMLRNQAQIYEAASSLPNNHHALLRFRSDDIAQHLNIPFQAVEVLKIVKPFRNQVAEAIGYSMKSNGRASLRSIKTAQGKIDNRFIAPPDFIQALEEMQVNEIRYGAKADRQSLEGLAKDGPIISTIPMGTLMKILDYPEQAEFSYRHGNVIKAEVQVPSDLCATIYYPDPEFPAVRATLTNDLLQIELVETFDPMRWDVENITNLVLEDFGLEHTSYTAEMVPQRYAKIVGMDDRERRKFIMFATDEYNIYSLGRFATWRERLLLDDVFHDMKKIMGMIGDGHNYHGRLR
jgi:hypothetical protein